MKGSTQKLDWSQVAITEDDLESIYNFLLEKETPMTPFEMAEFIISERIKDYQTNIVDKANADESLYRPSAEYKEGDTIEFPCNGSLRGVVESVRSGNNPDLGSFSVIKVTLSDGSVREFASQLEAHKLNDYDYSNTDRNNLDKSFVFKKYGKSIAKTIAEELEKNEDLVKISGFWFPQALLSEVNPGFLNLAEAVLEMEEGRPVRTKEILEQVDYPIDSNEKLTEFSFNFALQQDERFAEVGPVGCVLWTLKELQPEDVRRTPLTLQYIPIPSVPVIENTDDICSNTNLFDELDPDQLTEPAEAPESFDICITYPHWKAGTLPLIGKVHSIFPTALETDNVVFTFRDRQHQEEFPGWVIISKHYVSGLKQWYRTHSVIPGSIFRISKTDQQDVVEISLIPPRASKDWVRTLRIDEKGKADFETRQQKVSTLFDERLVIYVENKPQLDTLWEANNREGLSIKKQVDLIFNKLKVDNPQGILHFFEIYAAMNVLRRIPPKELYAVLVSDESITQIDRYTFKLTSAEEA